MSGDVQPRKRKDKRKKRDDSDAKAAELFARKMSVLPLDDDEPKEKASAGVHATKMGPDDIQLHVHSDHGTGGHWCAKILFFSLMAVLLGLIGLILLENRGLSDLDTPLSESRFADYLEGWVEEKRESHDDQHDVLESLHDELDEHDIEPFEEEDEGHDDDDDDQEHDNASNEEEDEEDGNDDHGVDGQEEENDNPDDDDDDDTPRAEHDNPDDDDDDDTPREERDTPDDDDDDDTPREKRDTPDDDDDDDTPREKRDTPDDDDDDDTPREENDNPDGDDDDTPRETDEVDDGNDDPSFDQEKDVDNNDNEDNDEGFEDQLSDNDNIDDDDNSPFEEHVSKANTSPSSNQIENTTAYVSAEDLKNQVDELYEQFNKLAESLNIQKIDAANNDDDDVKTGNYDPVKEDDDDASSEQFIDNDKGEDLHLKKLTEAAESQNEEDEQQEESSSLTVKLGVGLALVVVAHLVLVKRSKSNEEENIEPEHIEPSDLKRRFTLITQSEPLPSDVDDEQPNEEDDEEYVEDDLKDEDEDNADEEQEDGLNEDEVVEDNENENDEEGNENEEEEIENENSNESGEEVDDIENLVEGENAVDTFTEMKNMYRPKADIESVTNNEKVQIKEPIKDQIDLESDAEEDVEGSEHSGDIEDIEDIEDEEEDEEDEEEISDVDDDDLMKRLESKYGKLPERNSSDDEEVEEKWTKVKRGGPQENDDDFEDELRRANERLYDNPTSALKSFELLIEIKPNSSTAWYGKAQALDALSEQQKSNEILKEAIAAYVQAVEFGSSVDDGTFKTYAERCIERMRFIGQHLKAVPVHEALIERFNDEPYYRNQLAVTYLLVNRLAEAKLVLHETLLRWRQDGFALVHYGFVLKNLDKNNEAAVAFLQEGIDTDAEGTNDGRFYFNLGEALTRLGRNAEAMAVYRKGASKKLFLSEYQRSLYNVDRLKSRPFWTKEETGYKHLDVLQQNWEKIRDEGLSVLNERGHFTDEAENLRDVGDWKQFDLFARGRKVTKHCEKTPFTCKIIETFPAARFCKRGQVKFSVMHPGTHVWPHCGPTNCRIRVHLGLKVPEKTFIRVATKTRSWKEGELLIFDDSFEHEVWHNGTKVRLVLIVDVWHPDLTDEERTNLYPI